MIPDGFPGSTLEAFAEGFDSGLVGTLAVTIDDGDGNNVVARTTASIAQIQTVGAFGVYRYLGVYPNLAGTYLITWDDGVITGSEEFVVSFDIREAVGPSAGPCEAWVTGPEVAEVCGAAYDSDTSDAFDDAAEQASDILFHATGGLFTGLCGPVTVRPNVSNHCRCWTYPLPATGVWGWDGLGWGLGRGCCPGTDRITLAGYPVVAVTQVKIDGDVVPPSGYRLENYRHLLRLADADGDRQRWPTCQREDLDDSETGTFAVTYWWGAQPPAIAVEAAAQLGCELYRSRPDTTGTCKLPTGVKRIVRQGLTIETVSSVASMIKQGATGILAIDAFISAYGKVPDRRPSFWSSSGRQYPKRVG